MSEQKQNTEFVQSLRLVGGKWHAALLKNQRMESVHKADTLQQAIDFQNKDVVNEALPEGTRVIITTVIVLPENGK